jgi:hypothetical protein
MIQDDPLSLVEVSRDGYRIQLKLSTEFPWHG